jgi:hypothetical protein
MAFGAETRDPVKTYLIPDPQHCYNADPDPASKIMRIFYRADHPDPLSNVVSY